MALVKLVSAAWMRFCLLPQPNWTRLPLRQAAEGNAAGGGGNDGAGRGAEADVLVRSRSSFSVPSRSKGVSSRAARSKLFGVFEGRAADIFLEVFDDDLIERRDGLRGAAEGDRAAGLGLAGRGRRIQACATDTVSRWSGGIRSPSSGSARAAASKPGRSAMAVSAPSRR